MKPLRTATASGRFPSDQLFLMNWQDVLRITVKLKKRGNYRSKICGQSRKFWMKATGRSRFRISLKLTSFWVLIWAETKKVFCSRYCSKPNGKAIDSEVSFQNPIREQRFSAADKFGRCR